MAFETAALFVAAALPQIFTGRVHHVTKSLTETAEPRRKKC